MRSLVGAGDVTVFEHTLDRDSQAGGHERAVPAVEGKKDVSILCIGRSSSRDGESHDEMHTWSKRNAAALLDRAGVRVSALACPVL